MVVCDQTHSSLPALLQGEEGNDELLPWEEMALRHGSEAVIILSDINHGEPVMTTRSSTGPLSTAQQAMAVEQHAEPAPEAPGRTGFLGRMAQHRSKRARARNALDKAP